MASDPIEYLLNAMEHAAQSPEPFKAGYGDKRKSVLDAIVALRAALTAERERAAKAERELAELKEFMATVAANGGPVHGYTMLDFTRLWWEQEKQRVAVAESALAACRAELEQARRDALEEAAKLCENIAEAHLRSGSYVSIVADRSVRAGGQVDGAEECATAIRDAALLDRKGEG